MYTYGYQYFNIYFALSLSLSFASRLSLIGKH